MVFISCLRESWKTAFAHSLLPQFPPWNGLFILDEINKYGRWRQMVKGLYDKRKNELKILVTGNGRFDYYGFGGDSLQGRIKCTGCILYRLLSLGKMFSRTREN